jgi:hypothetical protein
LKEKIIPFYLKDCILGAEKAIGKFQFLGFGRVQVPKGLIL